MRKGLRFAPETTQVVFFDLEYFVPAADRKRTPPGGLTFSPVRPGHKILGGTFLSYYPMQDKVGERHNLWEWKQGDERKVLQAIYNLLTRERKLMNTNGSRGSLLLSGIGISHSDVPVLLARMASNTSIEREKVYDLLFGCRHIDLSVATFCQFSFNQSYFSYPKAKADLYQKYLEGKKMESGTSVWKLYDSQDYQAIEDRCNEEVDDALAIYRSMFDLKKKQDAELRGRG
jgi:hypothetical protein